MTTCIVSSGIPVKKGCSGIECIQSERTTPSSTLLKPRPLCRPCVEGTMRQTSTDHRREHRIPSGVVDFQLTLDAYSHGSSPHRGYRYGDLFTDINTGEVFPIMTKDRGAEELCLRAGILFDSHPEWRSAGSDIDRFIRVDPDNSYWSTLFMQCAGKYGYQHQKQKHSTNKKM